MTTATKVNQSQVTSLLNVARAKKEIDFGLYQSKIWALLKLIRKSKKVSQPFSFYKINGELRYANGRFFSIYFSNEGNMCCRYYEKSIDDFRSFRVENLSEIFESDLPF